MLPAAGPTQLIQNAAIPGSPTDTTPFVNGEQGSVSNYVFQQFLTLARATVEKSPTPRTEPVVRLRPPRSPNAGWIKSGHEFQEKVPDRRGPGI